MIIAAKLPPLEHYEFTSKNDRGAEIYSDRFSERIQILIPHKSQWGQTWKIHIQESKNKSDQAQYLTRVRFKCLEVEDQETHTLERDLYKGFIGSAYQCEFHYCLPTGDRFWLSYTVRLKEQI